MAPPEVAPRRLLPSTAITRRPATSLTLVAIHPPNRASRSLASKPASVRRIVDSEGSTTSGLIPSWDNASRSASATHSPTARSDFAPASTAAAASVNTTESP